MLANLLLFCTHFLLSTWKQVSACSNDGPCRNLAFPSFLFFADKRLMNHTITTLKVRDLDECELRCYYEHNCVSLNFENKMVGNEKYSCELNNSTHEEHGEDFVETTNFLYRGTNNPCVSSPCENNGTCQSGFTKKGYHCLCRGWTGAICQMDINECDENSHECSQNADCKNTKGSYRCKCKTGFHGDGYNCTDIDECEKKRCGKNATCTNTEGSFRCTCNFGYYGDGYKCTECYTIFDFEDHDLSNWTLNGTAFNNQPTYGNNTLSRPGRSWSNHKGDWWIGTFENRPSPSEPFGGQQGDGPQGSMTSPSFQITGKLLTFLIGGGCKGYTVPDIRAELIINGEVVREETPTDCDEAMTEKSWNVTDYAGKNAQLRLVDHFSGHFGHINFDHLQACL